MNKQQFTLPSSDGQHQIQGYLYMCPHSKAVIQMIHGMAEWTERYEPFFTQLNQAGFAVIAHDHLGHGRSAQFSKEGAGYMSAHQPDQVLIDDAHLIAQLAQEIYPDLPLFVVAHSMGSFVARLSLAQYKDYKAAVIMGTSGPRPELNIILPEVDFLARYCGTKINTVLDQLAFGLYRFFIHQGLYPSNNHWLSHNEENITFYDGHPWLGFTFTNNGFAGLFHLLKRSNQRACFKNTPNIPLFLLSGIDDPIGNFGCGPSKVVRRYARANKEKVQLKLYPKARHELLQENIHQEVTADIIQFFNLQLK